MNKNIISGFASVGCICTLIFVCAWVRAAFVLPYTPSATETVADKLECVEKMTQQLNELRLELREARTKVGNLKVALEIKANVVETVEAEIAMLKDDLARVEKDRKYAWEQADIFSRMASDNRQEMETWQEIAKERKQQLDEQVKQ